MNMQEGQLYEYSKEVSVQELKGSLWLVLYYDKKAELWNLGCMEGPMRGQIGTISEEGIKRPYIKQIQVH